MYRRYHRFIERELAAHRAAAGGTGGPHPSLAAWAVVGLGTVSNIARELGLLGEPRRRRLFASIGRLLLDQVHG